MRLAAVLLVLTGQACGLTATAETYDPLRLPDMPPGETIELAAIDRARDREIPLRLYLPHSKQPAPMVLFSHGLGGTRRGCSYLGQHWSARGYVAVFLQHPGSDDAVWKDQPLLKRMAAMRKAASAQNFLLRVQDVPAVLDQLQEWNQEPEHRLAGRLDLARVGMSGHSFGAMTTQAVSGQSFGLAGQRFTDPRIKAAIALSPGSPRRGDPEQAFGKVQIPWLLMTGTKDTSPIGGQSVESRMAVYPHLPRTIDSYQLVLHRAEHSAFTDRALPGDKETRNPNHHRAILATATAFWDAYLREDTAAREWLQGAGPGTVLEEQDRWQEHSPED